MNDIFFSMSRLFKYRSDKNLKTSILKMFGLYLFLTFWFTIGDLLATTFLPNFLLPFAQLLASSSAAP